MFCVFCEGSMYCCAGTRKEGTAGMADGRIDGGRKAVLKLRNAGARCMLRFSYKEALATVRAAGISWLRTDGQTVLLLPPEPATWGGSCERSWSSILMGVIVEGVWNERATDVSSAFRCWDGC